MLGRLLDVLIGWLTLGFAAIALMSGWGLLWALAFAAVGVFEIYLGMRRPPEQTWWERRRGRRRRAQIAKLNAVAHERELQELLGEAAPLQSIKRRPGADLLSLVAASMKTAFLGLAALAALAVGAFLVIAAIHGFA